MPLGREHEVCVCVCARWGERYLGKTCFYSNPGEHAVSVCACAVKNAPFHPAHHPNPYTPCSPRSPTQHPPPPPPPPPRTRANGRALAVANHHHARRPLRAVVREFMGDVATVFRQPVWRSVCASYTLYVAVLGVYAYWGPKAGE